MSRFTDRTGRIALGMVGGGTGAFIGGVHRIAARLDDAYVLVAGALSSTPERARESGAALGLDPARTYDDFAAMAEAEAARRDGIEAVSIVTPNHLHAAAARPFLERGIHVICDKPLCVSVAEAEALADAANASGAIFALTHNYTGYPMVREARRLVETGALGRVRLVNVEYAQDWLATAPPDNKQAAWRGDPARSGQGGATGDIGTHAFNLVRFVTGLSVETLSAELSRFIPDGRLDDNAFVTLRFEGGARGALWCSQVATGHENTLRLRVYGDAAGLDWSQEDPNVLWFMPLGEPIRRLTRGGSAASESAQRVTRIPAGHPEGFLEAFANVYAEAARAIRARRTGAAPPRDVLFPTVEDGVEGVRFVDACVRSSAADAVWVGLR